MLEKTASYSIVLTHYGSLTLADVDLHTFQIVEAGKKMQIVRGRIECVSLSEHNQACRRQRAQSVLLLAATVLCV